MLKILQGRLREYVNWELPDVQTRFRKGRRARDQIANIRLIIEKAREFQINVYFCFIDFIKAFDCVDCNKLWKTLQEMGQPDHLTCLLRNLHEGQEATEPDMELRTGSKLREECVKAVCCQPVSLMYMLLLLSCFSCVRLCATHRWQPTRLPRPWDSPGKNTGVGCHFLLQCMKVKSESEVAQSCLTLSDPMDCSLPGSSVHGIFQARVLEWGAIAFSNVGLIKYY